MVSEGFSYYKLWIMKLEISMYLGLFINIQMSARLTARFLKKSAFRLELISNLMKVKILEFSCVFDRLKKILL